MIIGSNVEICDIDDYKEWSPGIDVTLKEICLLGEQEVIERKIPSSLCFNGKEYERVQFSKTCKCVRSDYEWLVSTFFTFSCYS